MYKYPCKEQILIYAQRPDESTLNGIPGLGINMNTVGTEKIDDLQWDFMTGNTIDLEGLMYMPRLVGAVYGIDNFLTEL